MRCPFPPDLWRRLCDHLAAHATCQVTIHQHEGRIVFLDLGTVKERVKATHGDVLHVGDMPVYQVTMQEHP